jgi:hypothetical protein
MTFVKNPMKRVLFSLLILVVVFACKDDEKEEKTKTQLLTNGSSKAWNITDESPLDEDPNCRPTAEYILDNSWTFYADGKFTYDHGTVTDSESCGDLINFFGTWTLTNNESVFTIEADESFSPLVITGTLKSLTETSFVVEHTGGTVTFTPK